MFLARFRVRHRSRARDASRWCQGLKGRCKAVVSCFVQFLVAVSDFVGVTAINVPLECCFVGARDSPGGGRIYWGLILAEALLVEKLLASKAAANLVIFGVRMLSERARASKWRQLRATIRHTCDNIASISSSSSMPALALKIAANSNKCNRPHRDLLGLRWAGLCCPRT